MIDILQKIINARVKVREYLNMFFGPFRVRKLHRQDFTIISNNCWGGHVYRFFYHRYTSPTIGLYFYSEDFIKFIYNLKHYIDSELVFIDYQNSNYKIDLIEHNNIHCPIGKLDDIEIVFLHYKTKEEALEKWNKRKQRIVWDNIIYKMSEQNLCTIELLKKFDEFPEKRKLVFVTQDYGLKSQVFWGGPCRKGNISIDTVLFRHYVNLIRFINGEPNFKMRQNKALKHLKKIH